MYEILRTIFTKYINFPESQKDIGAAFIGKETYVFTLLSKTAARSFVRHSTDVLSSEHQMALETLEAPGSSANLLVARSAFIVERLSFVVPRLQRFLISTGIGSRCRVVSSMTLGAGWASSRVFAASNPFITTSFN